MITMCFHTSHFGHANIAQGIQLYVLLGHPSCWIIREPNLKDFQWHIGCTPNVRGAPWYVGRAYSSGFPIGVRWDRGTSLPIP